MCLFKSMFFSSATCSTQLAIDGYWGTSFAASIYVLARSVHKPNVAKTEVLTATQPPRTLTTCAGLDIIPFDQYNTQE